MFLTTQDEVKICYEFYKGIEDIAVIDESIGANTALNFAVKEKVKTIILLSSGEDYRGIKTFESAKQVKVPVLLIVGKKDLYSYESSEKINRLINYKKQLKIYDVKEHGTQLFEVSAAEKIILEWLKENL